MRISWENSESSLPRYSRTIASMTVANATIIEPAVIDFYAYRRIGKPKCLPSLKHLCVGNEMQVMCLPRPEATPPTRGTCSAHRCENMEMICALRQARGDVHDPLSPVEEQEAGDAAGAGSRAEDGREADSLLELEVVVVEVFGTSSQAFRRYLMMMISS